MAGTVQVAGLVKTAGLAAAEPVLAAGSETLAILPALILALTAAAVLALDLVLDRPRRFRTGPDAKTPAMIGGGFEADPLLFTSLLGLVSAAAFLGTMSARGDAASPLGSGVVADGLAAGSGILLLVLMATVLLAVTGQGGPETRGEGRRGGEFFCLMLLASAFLVLCVQSVGLATLFVSVEALSLTVFVLTSLERDSEKPSPSLLRTFIVSESASAGFLLGLVLLHGATGATSLMDLTASTPGALPDPALLACGATLTLVALAVKLLALPFAMRSRATTSDSMAAVQVGRSSQVGIAVLLLRAGLPLADALDTILVAGFVSAYAAALLGLGLWRVARSRGGEPLPPEAGVYHLGLLLTAVAVELAGARTDGSTIERGVPLLFYLFVAEAPRLGVAAWNLRREQREARSAPGVAVLLLSLGGLPPLPGFWARLILFREAITSGFGLLAALGAATSVGALYCAVAHAAAALRAAGDAPDAASEREPASIAPAIVTVIAFACLVVGVFPETLLALCRAWAAG